MRRRLLALALALLALAGCARREKDQPQGLMLYFTADSGQYASGPAIRTQPWEGEAESCTPEDLLRALLAGPTREGLTSPFPRGVSFVSLEREDTTAVVTLSEQYGGLTDMSLTLADYCIVLTLTQLEGVDAVEILPAGRFVNYRSHQILTREEALLLTEEEAS